MKAVYLKDNNNNKVVTVPYYRVGDLFLTTIATNPSNYLGGKWELFGPGRCLVCVDTSQTEFNSVKKTGGSKYLQQHYHDVRWSSPDGAGITISCKGSGDPCLNIGEWNWDYNTIQSDIYTTSNLRTNREGTGDSGNLQPYITCYVWIRTA